MYKLDNMRDFKRRFPRIGYFRNYAILMLLNKCPYCKGHDLVSRFCDVCEGKRKPENKIYWWNRFLNKLGYTGLRIGRMYEAKADKHLWK